MKPKIDVLIPTLNEATHIADAVANAKALGDVFVLDSFSTDGTQQLARDAGAHVVEHAFVNYSTQKNWALDNLPFTGEWIFILDADERLTPQLLRAIEQTLGRGGEAVGYYINRLLLIFGQAVRHGGLYPSWNLRLFKRGHARYEQRSVHEHMLCDGPTDYIREPMLHVRLETIAQYVAKHVRYADMESDEWLKVRLGVSSEAPSDKLFRHHLRWRQWLRRYAWPRTPGRPVIRWVYMYFVRLGILDGRAGWHLAWLMANYEFMITVMLQDKLEAARKQQRLQSRERAAASDTKDD